VVSSWGACPARLSWRAAGPVPVRLPRRSLPQNDPLPFAVLPLADPPLADPPFADPPFPGQLKKPSAMAVDNDART
jgi:hypothetical protein